MYRQRSIRNISLDVCLAIGERETNGTEDGGGNSGGGHARDLYDRLESHARYADYLCRLSDERTESEWLKVQVNVLGHYLE